MPKLRRSTYVGPLCFMTLWSIICPNKEKMINLNSRNVTCLKLEHNLFLSNLFHASYTPIRTIPTINTIIADIDYS